MLGRLLQQLLSVIWDAQHTNTAIVATWPHTVHRFAVSPVLAYTAGGAGQASEYFVSLGKLTQACSTAASFI